MIKTAIKQKSWWYSISDTIVYQRLKNPKAFNDFLEEISFYKSILGTHRKLIFDVGANVGTKSKIFLLLSELVISFEPDLKNFKILEARLKKYHNCIINSFALGSKEGFSKYYSIESDSAYNSLSEKHITTVVKNRGIINKKTELNQYEVKTNTLDLFISKYGIPYYIKIDVEGYEKEVILGLTQLIPLISIEANLPEFLPETLDIIDYLDKLSNGKYVYNYSTQNRLELGQYTSSVEFRAIISSLHFKSIEIYIKLETSAN